MSESEQDERRERLVSEALMLFRITHRKLKKDHPDLLREMENLISNEQKSDEIAVSQQIRDKNMETVMKFLKMKQQSAGFAQAVAEIIRKKKD